MEQNQENLFSEFPPVSIEEWEAKIIEDLKGADYAKKLIWNTGEGFDVKPYYTEADLKNLNHLETLPGEFPFVRSRCPIRHNWEIRQVIETDSPAEANAIALKAIANGATGFTFNAKKIEQTSDLDLLLTGIDLEKIHLNFAGARSYLFLAKLLDAYFRLRNVDPAAVRGTFDFDVLGYLLVHGDFYNSEADDLNDVVELVKEMGQSANDIKSINVNGRLFSNAGSTLVQELGYSLAAGNEYMALLTANGIDADTAAKSIAFSFATGSNFFPEIAKLRAARMLWAKIVEQYNPADARNLKILIQCEGAEWNKTVYDPYVNLLRTTTETMSAIIGGAQSISVPAFDLLYKQPDDFSERVARNQQIILKEEAYLNKVNDASAGSYYIESLTATIAEKAWKLFKEIEAMGGMLHAIKTNFIQDQVKSVAEAKKKNLATRKQILLGTNQYPNQNEFMLDCIQEAEDNEPETQEGNLCKVLEPGRLSEDFDDMRLATEIFTQEGNKRPGVFLLNYGNLAMRKARAMFTNNFFGCAGFEIFDNNGFASVEEGVKAALASDAEIITLCSSDEEYAESVTDIAHKIKAAAPDKLIVVAGLPQEHIENFTKAGVDMFIHVRANLLDTLKQTQVKLGIVEA